MAGHGTANAQEQARRVGEFGENKGLGSDNPVQAARKHFSAAGLMIAIFLLPVHPPKPPRSEKQVPELHIELYTSRIRVCACMYRAVVSLARNHRGTVHFP